MSNVSQFPPRAPLAAAVDSEQARKDERARIYAAHDEEIRRRVEAHQAAKARRAREVDEMKLMGVAMLVGVAIAGLLITVFSR
jgi:hypothetical protein